MLTLDDEQLARLPITVDPEIMSGAPVFRGTRVPVAALLDDLAALVERLRGQGATLRGPTEHPGGDRSAYVEDPEGNVVEVWDFFERGRDVSDLQAD